MQFNELGLCTDLLRAVAEQGYDAPTPIQSKSIPVVLGGHDLMAAAQTGTGKTAGFVLPVLQLLQDRPSGKRAKPRVLVMTPTRELAAQVEESVRAYGKYVPSKSAVIFGGVGMTPQIKALRDGVDIVVATPGRLLDHAGQKTIDLSAIEIFILDEADRMLDMGFIHDIRKVVAILPRQRQTLMFSATFSDDIRKLAVNYLKSPQQVEVAPRNATADAVAQCVYRVDKAKKRDLLIRLIDENNWHQVLVFTRTKHGANALAEKIDKAGFPAAAIHGNKSQSARTKALADFKSLKLHVLVATDIAARGIDIDQLPYVVNYELPNVPEDYVHRIGRTGRAGHSGLAVSLVSADESPLLADIEKLLKRKIEVGATPVLDSGSVRPQRTEANGRQSDRPEERQKSQRASAPSRQAKPKQPRAETPRQDKPKQHRPESPRQGQPKQQQHSALLQPGNRPNASNSLERSVRQGSVKARSVQGRSRQG